MWIGHHYTHILSSWASPAAFIPLGHPTAPAWAPCVTPPLVSYFTWQRVHARATFSRCPVPLPPQHPRGCSVCLCLHFFSVNRFASTIFLDSIYVFVNTAYLVFTFWLISLCIAGLYSSLEWTQICSLGIKLPYDPAIPLLGTYPEKNQTSKRHMKPRSWSTIYNSQDTGAAEMSIDRRLDMDKEVVIHNGILLSHNRKIWWLKLRAWGTPGT